MSGRVQKRHWDGLLPLVIPVVILVVWQVLGDAGILSTRILPTPLGVVQAGIQLSQQGVLWQYIGTSTERAFIGFFIGGSIGFLLGLLNGLYRTSEKLIDSSIQMIRTIPHLALIPLVIVWFGVGEEAKVFLVALGSLFPIYVNTFFGIKSVDADLIEMARVYRLSWWKMFWKVILPGALPSILVGVRYGLGVMWITLIVAETISENSGIGYMTMNAEQFMQMNVVVLGIVIYALLGKLSDWMASMMEKRWLQWHPNYLSK
ncbi:ABC transporter permease subunit [Alicyclobacillus cycloheptanicus]|uniref:Sulfonate transport system permease protein n=1 Tax=Alicyclobacillus cycloheptanicus TaxID=1457 RepID=A0ABT9XII8_9BACL|nr:ABC transporter permease subunit [Alicyclobacillus cycloheptanicus]MDQ0189588.1 sulfonate transport system permease protein [Alicyclobacillus cycloheptanicus]WDL99899.1 ABC transporter permease subunit [Alicyclobacillus cycloheptanicus]